MTPVSDEERYRRVVEEGSNRKRDLAGYNRVLARQEQAEREEWESSAAVSAVRSDLWPSVRERLRAALPESTFRLWVDPVEAVGATDDTLVLAAPGDICAWTERRYSALICEALRGTDFGKVRFVISGGER